MMLLFLLFLSFSSPAQSDPEAKKILDKLSTYYNSLSKVEVTFDLSINFAEQKPEIQTGKILKSGNKFIASIGPQEFINDGNAIYLILHPSKEIQISSIEDSQETMGISPTNFFDFYQNNEYEFAITQTKGELKFIEFKPLDKWSDYSKLRMTVNHVNNRILKLEAFGKDGSQYIFTIKNTNANPSITSTTFAFSKEKYKSYEILDLRQ